MHNFPIVIEKAGKNYSAYSPNLPGCVATGKTREETEERMHEAIVMHKCGLIDAKRSAIVRRAKVAKGNARKNKCQCGTAKDLLTDFKEEQ
ncbi:MAG: type II toxin-antitoxin system HicB family antitoxin [Methanoregula sp.]|uniref:type II toxin-antitoxin system HicB family antitoxin n=1 Tax=Methanoregula sp. TaxID=2052170 RepID=UPI003C162BD9